jgi:hypothetical protein
MNKERRAWALYGDHNGKLHIHRLANKQLFKPRNV